MHNGIVGSNADSQPINGGFGIWKEGDYWNANIDFGQTNIIVKLSAELEKAVSSMVAVGNINKYFKERPYQLQETLASLQLAGFYTEVEADQTITCIQTYTKPYFDGYRHYISKFMLDNVNSQSLIDSSTWELKYIDQYLAWSVENKLKKEFYKVYKIKDIVKILITKINIY
jgi:hypothetical protein